MVATLHAEPGAPPGVDNLILVSSDTHIGPLLSQLREYCPKKYLEPFDAFAADIEEQKQSMGRFAEMQDALSGMPQEQRDELMARLNDPNSPIQQMIRNRRTPGHHDMPSRIRDMNRDGLTAEILFHGSQNGEPVPFVAAHDLSAGLTTPFTFEGLDYELAEAGMHMFNEWLAEAVTVEPERHVGLAHVPAWDPKAATKEVEWAASKGLRGVNFPAWRPGMPVLQDPAWDDFYAACEACQMPLTNHGGAGDDRVWPPGEAVALRGLESAYHSKRLIWSLAYHGVFDKHPGLRLVIAEIPGEWWPYLMREMDTSPGTPGRSMPGLAWAGQERKKPSEVCATAVFHGATFMSPSEAQHAVAEDYWTNVMWGSDYPHVEGTWQFPADENEEPQTHLSLRDTFAGIDEEKVRAMVGLNAIDVFNLDRAKLQQVANRICAPSYEEVNTPLPEADIPPNHGMFAFRRHGPWA